METSTLLGEIKKSSSAWMKTANGGCPEFAWQSGYGAFAVGASQIESLTRYLDDQQGSPCLPVL